MTLAELNKLPVAALGNALATCCGSTAWVNKMLTIFPADDLAEILDEAEKIWYGLAASDWLEAFTHHPKIGDTASLAKKFASTAQWAGSEQSGVNTASKTVLEQLAEGNQRYEEKFGYIFIVCATGKTATEMLELLNKRLPNTPEEEIKIAMAEQDKITRLRLQKLLDA